MDPAPGYGLAIPPRRSQNSGGFGCQESPEFPSQNGPGKSRCVDLKEEKRGRRENEREGTPEKREREKGGGREKKKTRREDGNREERGGATTKTGREPVNVRKRAFAAH